MPNTFDDLQLFVNINNICVLTGAGISAESGVATFRGKDGLWAKFKPEELANVNAFLANPQMVWEWYQHRRDLLSGIRPNAGHLALAEWEKSASCFTLVTQNVDGLHQAAGSQRVLELHGNIRVNRCQNCGAESSMEDVTFDGHVPLCACGGKLRPGVVWFGELLPENVLREAIHAAQTCDLFMTVGTSAVVYPAAALPEMALSRGIPVIEVNVEATPFTPLATHHLRGLAGEILPALVAAYARVRAGNSVQREKE
jgi:NAD-dependent deacetylase